MSFVCPNCNKKIDIDFWDKYAHENPFSCELCGALIYLHFEEYYDEESGDEDTYYWISTSE